MTAEMLVTITKQQIFKMGGKFHGRLIINNGPNKKLGPFNTRQEVRKAIELELLKAEKLILSHRKLGIGKNKPKPKPAVAITPDDTFASEYAFPEPYVEPAEHEVEQRIGFKSSNPALQAIHEPEKPPISINAEPRPKMQKPADGPRTVPKPKAQGTVRKAPPGKDLKPEDIPWPLPPKRKMHNGYFSDDGSRADKKDIQLWILLARQDGLSWGEMSKATAINKSTVRHWAAKVGTAFADKRLAGGCPETTGE